MSNDGDRQASAENQTGTHNSYNDDFHALFDQGSIPVGQFNGRLLAWINSQLSASYVNVNDAMNAFAVSQGAPNWNQLGTFSVGGGGPPSNGVMLEDNASYLMMENNSSYIVQEV